MLSIGLWRWYISITITILGIIHSPVSYIKHNVSKTGFCLDLQAELTQLNPNLVRVAPEDGDRMQSPKRNALNERRDDG
jgi:hypothetical protein